MGTAGDEGEDGDGGGVGKSLPRAEREVGKEGGGMRRLSRGKDENNLGDVRMRGEGADGPENDRDPGEELKLLWGLTANPGTLPRSHYNGANVTRQVPAPADLHDPVPPAMRRAPAPCCGRNQTPGGSPGVLLRQSGAPPHRWAGSHHPARSHRGRSRRPVPAGCKDWRGMPLPRRDPPPARRPV